MEKGNAFLEVDLISAQNLKLPSLANIRRTETYALVWVDPSAKLRSRVDRLGAENPTWNDKFFFHMTPEVLSGDTSAITVEIYAIGYIRDYIVGTVRLFLSNLLADSSAATFPPCTAAGIRRPSGKIQGVLNIGVMLIDCSDFPALKGATAIGYRDLMGETVRRRKKGDRRDKKKKKPAVPNGEVDLSGESCETSCGDSGYFSDGCDSTTSSSSTASTVLKEWNGMRDLAGKSLKGGSAGGGFLCGLVLQR